MTDWVEVKRTGPDLRGEPQMTIRSSGYLAFNSEFTKRTGDKPYCTLLLSLDGSMLGVRLKDQPEGGNDYKLAPDGGSHFKKKGLSRVVGAISFVKSNPRLYQMSKVSMKLLLEKEFRGDVWFARLQPMFEQTRSDVCELPENVSGIYRLKLGDRVVYIGKGLIKDRVKSHQRAQFIFDKIEFSGVESEDEAFRWEAHYLSAHMQEFGVKPEYNRIMGRGARAAD